MAHSPLNKRISAALEILEALYFFLQSSQQNEERLTMIKATFLDAPREARQRLLDELTSEIKWLRKESGAIATNSEFVSFLKAIRQEAAKGHVLLPKWEMERRWFRNFGRVMVRWPHIKDHAMVIYDPNDTSATNQLFELEGSILKDAETLLEQAKAVHKGITDFRRRERKDQFLLHTYLRSCATITFHFLEAYLNGLAFDCLLRFHDRLSEDEHDMLVEWDRKKDSAKWIAVNTKIFRYPAIFGKHLGAKVDLSGCRAAHFLAQDAKDLRDALTHPSPHIDREKQTLRKVSLVATIHLEAVKQIVGAAKEYAVTVERALFGKPEETAPWLFQ